MSSLDTRTESLVSLDMSNEEYHAEREHISRTTAYRYRGDFGGVAQEYEDRGRKIFGGNSGTDFGTLVDVAVGVAMTGGDWKSAVVSPPVEVLAADGSRRGKAYLEWRSASVPAGAVECTPADHQKVADILDSLYGHRNARALLESCRSSQMSVFWRDADGHKRKARADGVTHSGEWFDLKTTSSEWSKLKWSFRSFGYCWQAVWYSEAAAVAGSDPFDFKFVVVQNFAPFAVQVFTLPQRELDLAKWEIRATLNDIRRRRETGEYLTSEYHAVKELEF
jgi:hypothetical protein